MDWSQEFYTWTVDSWRTLPLIVWSTLGIFVLVILYTRLFGLRSFSKMSSFDFAATVAVGSLIATTASGPGTSLIQGAVAILSLYVLQWGVARLRRVSDAVEDAVDNCPMLLMDGPNFLEDNMRECSVTRADLIAKLREANVIQLAQVRAVVLETTGDISVLHGEADGPPLEDLLIDEVRR